MLYFHCPVLSLVPQKDYTFETQCQPTTKLPLLTNQTPVGSIDTYLESTDTTVIVGPTIVSEGEDTINITGQQTKGFTGPPSGRTGSTTEHKQRILESPSLSVLYPPLVKTRKVLYRDVRPPFTNIYLYIHISTEVSQDTPF